MFLIPSLLVILFGLLTNLEKNNLFHSFKCFLLFTGKTYLAYVLDYDYIATILCINKEEPELKCNGKCYLKDQLSKVDNGGEKDNQSGPKIEFKKFVFNGYNSFWLNDVYHLFDKKRIWILPISIYSSWLKAIIPPPKN